jgi:hypothetical protein
MKSIRINIKLVKTYVWILELTIQIIAAGFHWGTIKANKCHEVSGTLERFRTQHNPFLSTRTNHLTDEPCLTFVVTEMVAEQK